MNIKEILNSLPENIIKILLIDRTTKRNIIFCTDEYHNIGIDYFDEITYDLITTTNIIKTRLEKDIISQKERVKEKAEVFTPSWICNKQNNLVDDQWFGVKGIFNISVDEHDWLATEQLVFPSKKRWQTYIGLKRLEIACGEAPYLTSRYDTVSGKYIEVKQRIGVLDRKLRTVNEKANNEEWFKYVIKAYKSTFGFELQGDNLLIARINFLLTFLDNYMEKFNTEPNEEELKTIAVIISWNLWQMDVLTMQTPTKNLRNSQLSLFENTEKQIIYYSKIKDWRQNTAIEFREISE